MKKLKLKDLPFTNHEILGRQQLKNLLGGSGYTYICCNDQQYCFMDWDTALNWCLSAPACYKCAEFQA